MQNEYPTKQKQPAFGASLYDTTTPVAVATVLHDVQTDSPKPETLVDVPLASAAEPTGVKRGQSCCGGCCDMRRAVIIVNSISVAMEVIGIAAVVGLLAAGLVAIHDDQTDGVEVVEQATNNYWLVSSLTIGIVASLSLFSILLSACGIYGAAKYKQGFVMVALVYQAVCLGVSIFSLNVIGAVVSGLFLYPHVILFREMQDGIMTEANYANEKQSCCCV